MDLLRDDFVGGPVSGRRLDSALDAPRRHPASAWTDPDELLPRQALGRRRGRRRRSVCRCDRDSSRTGPARRALHGDPHHPRPLGSPRCRCGSRRWHERSRAHGGGRTRLPREDQRVHPCRRSPTSIHAGRAALGRRDSRARRNHLRDACRFPATPLVISHTPPRACSSRATCSSQARSGAPTSPDRTGPPSRRRSDRSSHASRLRPSSIPGTGRRPRSVTSSPRTRSSPSCGRSLSEDRGAPRNG